MELILRHNKDKGVPEDDGCVEFFPEYRAPGNLGDEACIVFYMNPVPTMCGMAFLTNVTFNEDMNLSKENLMEIFTYYIYNQPLPKKFQNYSIGGIL